MDELLANNLLGHNVSVALIHWPIVNKARDVVATNITNFDIHDIARACRSYGVKKYFLVNRVQEQLMFVARVLDHWKVGEGSQLNPMRRTALTMIELEETIETLLAHHYPDEKPIIYATAARNLEILPGISFRQLRRDICENRQKEVLLLFGTGFGLADAALKQCDGLIEPIRGASEDDYRHLSVRSAVSICLDRLFGAW